MINNFLLTLFADYNCDAYGANAYGQCAVTTGNGGGLLAATGYNLIIPVAFGLALIIAATAWLIKIALRRRQQKTNTNR